jgi:C4-dicarboxylate-specific signal transduction histidine kinase
MILVAPRRSQYHHHHHHHHHYHHDRKYDTKFTRILYIYTHKGQLQAKLNSCEAQKSHRSASQKPISNTRPISPPTIHKAWRKQQPASTNTRITSSSSFLLRLLLFSTTAHRRRKANIPLKKPPKRQDKTKHRTKKKTKETLQVYSQTRSSPTHIFDLPSQPQQAHRETTNNQTLEM